MFRFVILLCLFFKITYIQAQEHTIPEYQKLKTYTYDSLRNAYDSSIREKPNLGKAYANAYYNKAVENNDTEKISKGALQYAIAYDVLGQKDSALYFINISLKESEKISDHQQYVNSLFVKGNIYYSATSYTEATEYYTRAYDSIVKDNDSIKLAKIAHNFALIKIQIGETKQALRLIKDNLSFYEDLNNKGDARFRNLEYINTLVNICNAYTNLAEDYPKHKAAYLDSATVYCSKGLVRSLIPKDNEAYCLFLTLQAIIQQKRGNYKASIDGLKSVEAKIINLKIKGQLPILYFYQGKNYFLQNDIDSALPYFLKVDSIIKKDNLNSIFLQENYVLLSQYYEQKKDSDKALHYLNIFRSQNDQNDEMAKKASQSIYHKYHISSYTTKIDQLVKDAKAEKNKTSLLLKISLFLIGILILGVLYYVRIKQNYKKRFKAIVEELNTTKEKATKEIQISTSDTYKISDENIQKILNGLESFEKEKMFLQQKCSINFLAKEIDTNATYLSKTLQSHKGKKFVQYITDLRINYALIQLKENKKFRAYDIKSIALELGFNTSESFSKSFKKQTGIYPSFYIKNLNSLEV